MSLILDAPRANEVVDCYTRAPVDKFTLLAEMQERFGLKYELSPAAPGIDATGVKMNYFSLNRRAEMFGYSPTLTALETVVHEASLWKYRTSVVSQRCSEESELIGHEIRI